MKMLNLFAAAAVSALALGAGGASAQTWVDDRYETLSERIDTAAREGAITTAESASLRDDLADVGQLGEDYRENGLSSWETSDLNRRFDDLAARIDVADEPAVDVLGWFGGPGWTDRSGAWMSVNARQAELDRRIDRGVATGQLTRAEAVRLRAEFRAIARLEARYRMNGMSAWERGDLDRRFDVLAANITLEARDSQYGYGYGRY